MEEMRGEGKEENDEEVKVRERRHPTLFPF